MKPEQQCDLYQAALEWLATCSTQCIASNTLERRFNIGPMRAAALADQLEDAGVLSSPLPPHNQRRNYLRKRKSKARAA